MKIRTLLLIALSAFTVASCTSTKKIAYFQGVDDKTIADQARYYQVRIMPNDNLHITVSSINPEAVKIFNSLNTEISTNINSESLNIMGYIVDNDGNINFPVLGTIHLGGLTKAEAIDLLKDKISEYVIDPTVNIRFINYKVTVLGEVARPGTYTIKDERITLPEALGLAGDMTIYGKRDNVLVYREVDGKQTFQRIDMTSPDVFTSEYFYLHQNDVVYVQLNRAKSGSSAYNQNLSLGVSMVSLLVTLITVLTR